MRLFELHRFEDESGVSGAGKVAQGVEFDNGWCAMAWLTVHTSVAFYPSILEVEAIHGHGGKTVVKFLTDETPTIWPCRLCGAINKAAVPACWKCGGDRPGGEP